MINRVAGLLLVVSGIIGYLICSERLQWVARVAHPFPEGYATRMDPVEAASIVRFWTVLSTASILVAAVGIGIIVISYNRIRRNKQANGRQSNTDHR